MWEDDHAGRDWPRTPNASEQDARRNARHYAQEDNRASDTGRSLRASLTVTQQRPSSTEMPREQQPFGKRCQGHAYVTPGALIGPVPSDFG